MSSHDLALKLARAVTVWLGALLVALAIAVLLALPYLELSA